MRRLLLLALLATPLSLAVTHAASAQGRQDFALVNRTGYQINELYVGASSSDSWGDDLLRRSVLPDRGGVNVTFAQASRECRWDIKVVYDDGDESEFLRVDLCRVSRLTLFWNRQAGETRVVAE